MNCGNLYNKLFVSDRFFTIAIRKKNSDILQNNFSFKADYTVPANRTKWYADPMLAEDNGRTYMFYEAVDNDKGHIEAAELLDDCSLGTPVTILQDECHYSYPFVFKFDWEWYMIPESSAANEMRLYKSVSFPYEWRLEKVLLNVKAVDTTVFDYNGQSILLTYIPDDSTEKVVPHAYRMEKNFSLSEIPWHVYDALRVRGAGPLFLNGGKLIRPAQISREQRYGDGILFYQAEIDTEYSESPVGELKAEKIYVDGYQVDGAHTYVANDRFEVIDIRCCVIDPLKAIHKIKNKLF